METQSSAALAELVRNNRVAALGTLRKGAPLVTMVPYAVSRELTSFMLHISRLAFHTQDILADPRVSLMICEPDTGDRDPQTLARVSVSGEAQEIAQDSAAFAGARGLYLARFPEAERNFSLGDFGLYRIEPHTARFVAGFGRIFNLTLRDFAAAGSPTQA